MSGSFSSFTRNFSGRTPLIGVAILIVVIGGLVVDADKNEGDNFYENIIRLEQVATKIHQNYVEDVKSDALVDKAIDGMLQVLDPHTSYFEKKQYEELRIHTEGQFGGLGIQISIRDQVLTVMTPISGTPASRAGIRSGDQIINIGGVSTKGIKIDEAVGKLRGEPGTEVTITIRRKGEPRDVDYTITREIIQIRSVPFAGVLDGGIGYVRLVTFSQDAGGEVEKAVKDLLKKEIRGLILDLRHNPGGLLPQAIEVAEKILPRKKMIVSTRGRVRGQNKDFESTSNPVLPADMPLVVLVNHASASASEIVAGAIQDWDRGIILGDTTFGKGSVQSILPLDKTHHLKLTTAFYYTPSGRCINKPENAIRSAEGEPEDSVGEAAGAEDEEAAAEPRKIDTTAYRTENGRRVCGGGGIVPDTVVEDDKLSFVLRSLFGKDVFFKFANAIYPRLRDQKIVIDRDFKVNDKIMKDFQIFLDSIEFKIQTFSQAKFDDFKKQIGIGDSLVDSSGVMETELDWTGEERVAFRRLAEQVESILLEASSRLLGDEEMEIRNHIAQALMIRELGQDNEIIYRRNLARDVQLKAAIDILRDRQNYARLLAPPGK